MAWNRTIIVRRPRLGRTSAREIASRMSGTVVHRIDRPRPQGPFDLCIRWGCTTTVPEQRVLNTAEAIHAVNDKIAFRRLLMPHNLCPRTWFSEEGFGEDVYPWGYPLTDISPVVVRPRRHAQGRRLFLCANADALFYAIRACGPEYYISPLIPKTHEYRVFFVQGRVAWVAQKTPGNPQDVAWNVARGGRFDNVRWSEWPLKVVRYAHEAFVLTGLDFGGVDVMYDAANGTPYVLETNSAPSQTSPYRQEMTGKCFEHIIQKENKERIPLIEGRGNYKKFIHPALTPEALLV